MSDHSDIASLDPSHKTREQLVADFQLMFEKCRARIERERYLPIMELDDIPPPKVTFISVDHGREPETPDEGVNTFKGGAITMSIQYEPIGNTIDPASSKTRDQIYDDFRSVLDQASRTAREPEPAMTVAEYERQFALLRARLKPSPAQVACDILNERFSASTKTLFFDRNTI